jgi:hypothetical protein
LLQSPCCEQETSLFRRKVPLKVKLVLEYFNRLPELRLAELLQL